MLRTRFLLSMMVAFNLFCQVALDTAHAAPQSWLDGLPSNAAGIDVLDQVGDFIPAELSFRDDTGRMVRLSDYLKRDKAIVLTLNYSDCPGLCMAQLDNLVETLRKLDCRGMGDSFELISLSIDPREEYQKAARTKAKYVGLLGDEKGDKAWHFLVGKQPEITDLAKAVGFYYTYDKVNDRFNHPAVTYFISADGRICRYFLDLGIEPEQFQLALADAAEGRLSRSLAETFVQFCFTYDPDANRYSASARKILALGGGAFTVLLLGFLAPFWFSSRRGEVLQRRDTAGPEDAAAS